MRKKLARKFEHIKKMLIRIDEYNEYLDDNKYYEGRGSNPQLSFNVKVHAHVDGADVVEKYLDVHGITDHDRRRSVIEEFDDARLDGIFWHTLQQEREWFI